VANIIVGILFIIGGLSGALALRGTGSPIALAVLGVVLLIVGFVQVSGGSKKSKSKRYGGNARRTGRTTRSTQSRRRAG
jgi:4-hydroxybenzoate polyprenyltransferase